MTHPVTDFTGLMEKYAVPRNDAIEVGPTDYLDRPVKDQLFQGVDTHGRAFINLPVTVRASPLMETALSNDLIPDWRNTAFVVFQRYTSPTSHFALGGELYPMTIVKMLGAFAKDFSKLEKLLDGESLRFYSGRLDVVGVYQENPDYWIDITLQSVA